MKFYLENDSHFKAQRRAHILKDDSEPLGKCWCKSNFNPQKWAVVEEYLKGLISVERVSLGLIFRGIIRPTYPPSPPQKLYLQA
jgi:hypothetical protein